MPFSDWLRYSLSILLEIVNNVAVNKITAAFRRFRSVCEVDLDKGLNDK